MAQNDPMEKISSFRKKLLSPKAYRTDGNMLIFLGMVVILATTLVAIGDKILPGIFDKPVRKSEILGRYVGITIGYAVGVFLIIRGMIKKRRMGRQA